MKRVAVVLVCVAMVVGFLSQTLEASTGPSPPPPLQLVPYVDLTRYVGVWYEIAHLPNKAQEDCTDSIVRFALRINGEIDVLNSCRDKKEGKLHHADGRGWVVDTSSNARVKVSYLWPLRKEYVFIDQGNDYEYAVICTVDRKHLWIISRTPTVPSGVFENIAQHIETQGFHREGLIITEHTQIQQER
jgi:apolipoprotein D and lipocalin family protein